jgi:hypothetical protein
MDDDRNAPATKGDLAELESRILARMEAALDERETRMIEAMRDGQTEILKAFYGFTATVQTRFRVQDDTEAGLKKRLTVLEERVLEVERRLNMPPAA